MLRYQPTIVQRYGAPVLALCGFSGSGKTTLLEAAIQHLIARGLAVAAIKHDAHGFTVDKEGKDSDRFFRAGATVDLRGPDERFLRRGSSSVLSLEATLSDLARDHDLLLVEGHKDTPLPKLWVGNAETSIPPEDMANIQGLLPWNGDRLTAFLQFIDEWLPKAWGAPLFAGLLVGGQSSRMGRPKQLVGFGGSTFGEIAARALSAAVGEAGPARNGDSLSPKVAILGAGPIPDTLQCLARVPDVPRLAGPIAGLLAAHRWAPGAAWVLAACDHPWVSAADIRWLMHRRRPGIWAILPRQSDDHPCPTLALYEPQALEILERSLLGRGPDQVHLAELFKHPRTLIAPIRTRGLVNVNTPQELIAQEELAKAKAQPSMWKKHRPKLNSDEQLNSDTSRRAAPNVRRCSE